MICLKSIHIWICMQQLWDVCETEDRRVVIVMFSYIIVTDNIVYKCESIRRKKVSLRLELFGISYVRDDHCSGQCIYGSRWIFLVMVLSCVSRANLYEISVQIKKLKLRKNLFFLDTIQIEQRKCLLKLTFSH